MDYTIEHAVWTHEPPRSGVDHRGELRWVVYEVCGERKIAYAHFATEAEALAERDALSCADVDPGRVCERCGRGPAEEIPNHGFSEWLCEGCYCADIAADSA